MPEWNPDMSETTMDKVEIADFHNKSPKWMGKKWFNSETDLLDEFAYDFCKHKKGEADYETVRTVAYTVMCMGWKYPKAAFLE